jgi:hypothetical protein
MFDGAIMALAGLYVSLMAYGLIPDPTTAKRFSSSKNWKLAGPALAAIGIALAIADALRVHP